MLSPSSLSPKAREIISDEANVILVSAASAWEIAIKVRLGKLPGAEILERDFLDTIARAGYTLLPIDAASALRAGRLLAAHALAEDIPILSLDEKLDSFAIRRLW